jgi:protease I
VLPGGVANPDQLRTSEQAIVFTRHFHDTKKPIAVICHGSWTLIEAGVVKGRMMTSWPSLKTDLVNAGARWVDREVVVDQEVVSSRKPDDLTAFCAKILEELAAGRHQARGASSRSGGYVARLKYCTARSCFSAAARVVKVPRLRRRPVFGFFLRE